MVIIKYHGRPTLSRTRYKKKQDRYVLPDTFYFKYPSLDTVWCNIDKAKILSRKWQDFCFVFFILKFSVFICQFLQTGFSK